MYKIKKTINRPVINNRRGTKTTEKEKKTCYLKENKKLKGKWEDLWREGLWKRNVLNVEWKSDGVMDGESGDDEADEVTCERGELGRDMWGRGWRNESGSHRIFCRTPKLGLQIWGATAPTIEPLLDMGYVIAFTHGWVGLDWVMARVC